MEEVTTEVEVKDSFFEAVIETLKDLSKKGDANCININKTMWRTLSMTEGFRNLTDLLKAIHKHKDLKHIHKIIVR